MNLKVGDKVIVIAGKDKGKEGKIIAKKGEKVFVEGINMVKKHVKPNGQDQVGGIIDKEAPIDLSNVMYLYKGKPVRVGFQGEKKDKVRVAHVDGKLEKID